ncbi:unnamed protein product, partial [Closterium sp. NIES-53]
ATALGASESAAALGASESAAALGASESVAAPDACESAAALGARASPATGPSSAEALHTFILDSGTSRCFFRDCTTLTPLAAPVPVSLADPTGGPVVARVSTVLPCPAVPSGSLSGLHLPTFSTNLVSNAAIQDVWVDTFIPGGQRVAICQVAASSQVSSSGQLAASCSMHSCLLVSGLPRSLPSLLHSPTPPCLLCVEGRQRAAPHSSEFPPTSAPLQTLHMDVWGPAPVGDTDQERYFLLVVDDYTRYTTVFPLRRKADVSGVLIPWIRATHRQLRKRFSRDFPVLRLHSDRGGEFSSDLLAEFCRDEGIHQSFTLPASPKKNGIAERRIGLIMELNLWPCVSEPETSPTLRWMGKVGDASVFWVWGALSLVHDAKARKLSSRTLRSLASPPTPCRGSSTTRASVESSPPRTSPLMKTSPTLRWMGKVGDASVFWVWGALSLVHDAKARKLSSRTLRSLASPPTPCRGSSTTRASVESSPPRTSPLMSLSVSTGYTRTRPTRVLLPQTAGAEPGGAETEGEGFGRAATGGAGSGGAAIGGYGPAGAGAASPGGTAGAGGNGGIAGGAAGAGGTRGAAGAGGVGATSPRGATGAGGAGPTSPGGTAGAGGGGGAAGAGGAGAGGTGGAGGAGPGGARTGGAGAAGAG